MVLASLTIGVVIIVPSLFESFAPTVAQLCRNALAFVGATELAFG
jgi:hypothetical protein